MDDGRGPTAGRRMDPASHAALELSVAFWRKCSKGRVARFVNVEHRECAPRAVLLTLVGSQM